jgi:type III pantothenate kinase
LLGPDRACAVAAAYRRYRGPVIVVDCGTAITFDAVSRSGVHMGGLISPGLTISAEALSAGTAALPRAESSGHPDLIGKNTAGSIRAGILYGVAGGIREITGRLKKTLGRGTTVVGCGGDAAGLQEEFSLFDIVHRHIVLEGACIILRNTIRRAARKKSSRVTSSRPGASR